MATEAPPPPAQAPDSGATAPVPILDPKKTSRFSRDDVSSIQDPLLTTNVSYTLRYPEDIGNQEYPHYVAFYPLIREGTQLGQELLAGGGLVVDQSDQNRLDPENGGKAAKTAGAIIGATAGAAAGLGMGAKLLKNGGNLSNRITTPTGGPTGLLAGLGKVFVEKGAALVGGVVGAAGGAVVGAGAGTIASQVAGTQKLIFGDSAIILHITEKVSSGYNANWETADLGGLVGAVASGKMSADSLFNKDDEFNFGALVASGGELGDYALRKLGKVANIAGFDSLTNVIQASSKRVENPYKEQLFRSMGFRKFGFDYRFSPRNEAEALEVFGRKGINAEKDGIIATFLRHMHPTRSQNGLFLTYPSEFLIMYYHEGEENNFVRKISNCALTDMNIEYGAEGFTTFANGCPTEAFIRLQFTELETLTTDRIEKGF